MISAFLKERTKHLHDETEERLNSQKIFDKSYTLEDYKKLLFHNYQLISNYEPLIHQKLNHHPELKLELRQKLEALKKDIKSLEVDMETLNIDNELLETEAEAFGALYVIEGSTLGGNVIVKQLKKNPEFENIDFNYFGIYGENTGPLWLEFKTFLDERIKEEHYEECISGAKKAYALL